MRLLHTSDWHLGQDFHRFDRRHEHSAFLAELLKTLVDTQTDVLLIAGDVFDVANPSSHAQRQFYEFLVDAKARIPWLRTIVIAGNHDSGARLEAPSQVLKTLDVHVVGRVTSTPTGIVSSEDFLVPLFDRRSDSGTPVAVCVALPFLKNADVQWSDEPCSYSDAVVRAYGQAVTAARERFGNAIPLIAMGHLHARGGLASQESERPLIIGGEEAVPFGELAGHFCYVALGHLHLGQAVGGFEHVRYSGSPLPMSFSEINYKHQVVLVDVEDGAPVAHTIVRLQRPVELVRCPAQPAELNSVLQALQQLTWSALPEQEKPYLNVQVRLDGPVPNMRQQIETALKGTPARLAKISVTRSESGTNDDSSTQPQMGGLDSLRNLDPTFVFRDLHQRKYACLPDDDLMSSFHESLRLALAEEGE